MSTTPQLSGSSSHPNVRPGAPGAAARSARLLPIVLLIGVVAAGAYWAWHAYFQTYHLQIVQAGVLYRDGNRSLTEFKTALRKGRVKSVVCLVDDREAADPRKPQLKGELDYLQTSGIFLERIPVRLGGWPTSSDVQRFLRMAENRDRQPVLIHCAQGVRRTGMMVAAYQMSILNFDKQRAKNAIQAFGHSSRTTDDVKRFIDLYDPATRTVDATGLPVNEGAE